MSNSAVSCFGFFGGGNSVACTQCAASKRCKAILVTHGFDILDATVDVFFAKLPPTFKANDTDRLSELVKTLVEPGSVRTVDPFIIDKIRQSRNVVPEVTDIDI